MQASTRPLTVPRANGIGPRGPWSRLALALMHGEPAEPVTLEPVDDPIGDDDLHLALYLCYELHYRGIPGVDESREWDPRLLELRLAMETTFLDALAKRIARAAIQVDTVHEGIRGIAGSADAAPLAAFLERDADLEQMSEFLIHRSAYQLKEADPHSWAIPRLEGSTKSALVEIQYDEYGSGDATWMHAELFRRTLTSIGLDGRYGAYVNLLPGTTLATVNLVSLFGLHRRWRGALLGHLALFEMTSAIPNRSYGNGLRRLGFGEEATRFFDEHVEADSLHEVLARDLAVDFAQREPALAGDVLFGARSLDELEARFGASLLEAWSAGRSSLLGEPVTR
jgi:hypothetical protein